MCWWLGAFALMFVCACGGCGGERERDCVWGGGGGGGGERERDCVVEENAVAADGRAAGLLRCERPELGFPDVQLGCA